MIGGLYMIGPDGSEMPDFVGFCESEGKSRGIAVVVAQHLPKTMDSKLG